MRLFNKSLKLKFIHGTNQAIWFCLVLITSYAMLFQSILISFTPFPLEIREGATSAITWLILHKGLSSLYTSSSMPTYNNVYGMGFSLISIPWVIWIKNIAIGHRFSAIFCSLLAALVFYAISYKTSKNRVLSFALLLAFVFNLSWAGVANETWGDAAGLLVGQLILLIAVSSLPVNYKAISIIGLTLFAYLIKPYFAFYGIAVFIWLPLATNWKQTILWYSVSLAMMIIFVITMQYYFPWYLWNTFIQYSAYLGGTYHHLIGELQAFWRINAFWVYFLVASSIAIYFLLNQNKSVLSDNKKNTSSNLFEYGSLSFWVYMVCFFGVAMFYMGRNTGRSWTYFVELFDPLFYLLVASVTAKLFSQLNHPRKFFTLYIVLSLALFPFIYKQLKNETSAFRQFITTTKKPTDIVNWKALNTYAANNAMWDKSSENDFAIISKFLENKKNVFHSPWLTNILLDQSLPIYDSSHTQHFRGPFQDNVKRDYFGLHLGRIVPIAKRKEAETIWTAYWDNVKRSIQNQKFDLIILEDEDYSKVAYLLMFDYAAYYAAQGKDFNQSLHQFYKLITINYKAVKHIDRLKLTIYEPKEIHAG